MKNNVHKMVTTITLILVTSVPFSLKALAEVEKKHSPISSLLIPDKSASAIRREALAEKNQHIVNEARESLIGYSTSADSLYRKMILKRRFHYCRTYPKSWLLF